MHARNISSDFPVRRTRVLSGAGDEESFETKDSPPAVAGPSRTVRIQDDHASQDLLLDLVTGTDSLAGSLRQLVAASGHAVLHTAGVRMECGVVVQQPGRPPAVAGTCDGVVQLLRREQQASEGPVCEVLAGGQPVAVLQRNGDFRWPGYCDELRAAGFGSALGIRLPLPSAPDGSASTAEAGPGSTGGLGPAALAFFSQDAKAFPLQAIAQARTFAGLAAKGLRIAIDFHTARSMASDLRSALDSRTSINVACGVIMAQNRCSYREAFSILAKASSHRNVKVRLIAEDILEKLPDGAPRAHFGR